jgi:hypothetical protein
MTFSQSPRGRQQAKMSETISREALCDPESTMLYKWLASVVRMTALVPRVESKCTRITTDYRRTQTTKCGKTCSMATLGHLGLSLLPLYASGCSGCSSIEFISILWPSILARFYPNFLGFQQHGTLSTCEIPTNATLNIKSTGLWFEPVQMSYASRMRLLSKTYTGSRPNRV